MPDFMNKSWAKGQPTPYQLGDITHCPDWGRLIVLDAFFNNLTSGLMLVCALVWAAGPALLASLMPWALTVALALLVIDLGILVLDLGDPPRFIHAMRVMRFTSPLSVGVWGLASYGAFLSAAALLAWILHFNGGAGGIGGFMLAAVFRLCAVMAIMAAVVVICYKGVVFSCSSQPGLSQARWLTPFMVSDSLLMGMGVFVILCWLFSPDGAACALLILPFIVLLAARCIAFGLLWQDVKNRARRRYRRVDNRLTALIVYGAGALIPLPLLFTGPFWMALAGCIVLGVGWYERKWLIGLARPLPGAGEE